MSYKEYVESLKESIREYVDGISSITDLEMLYGMAQAGFRDAQTRKGGAE